MKVKVKMKNEKNNKCQRMSNILIIFLKFDLMIL